MNRALTDFLCLLLLTLLDPFAFRRNLEDIILQELLSVFDLCGIDVVSEHVHVFEKLLAHLDFNSSDRLLVLLLLQGTLAEFFIEIDHLLQLSHFSLGLLVGLNGVRGLGHTARVASLSCSHLLLLLILNLLVLALCHHLSLESSLRRLLGHRLSSLTLSLRRAHLVVNALRGVALGRDLLL
jgi:hypothetical protein